jgi:hypothetical protein
MRKMLICANGWCCRELLFPAAIALAVVSPYLKPIGRYE